MNRATRALTWLILALMTAVSVAGVVLRGGLYRDEPWILAAWFGNDLVTLLVAVPLLWWALVAAGHGSRRGELTWYAMLGYVIYNFAYYLFGARMNALFPAYVALLVLSAGVLAVLLHRVDTEGLSVSLRSNRVPRGAVGYLAFTGVGLLVAWLAQWAGFVFAGIVPSVGEEAFTLIAALDLTFVVPLCLLSAALSWRGSVWGWVFGAIMCVKGATYTLVLTSASTVAALRGVEGAAAQVPVWVAWTIGGVIATVALFRRVPDATGDESTPDVLGAPPSDR